MAHDHDHSGGAHVGHGQTHAHGGHSHAPSVRAGARHLGALVGACALVVAFLGVQVVTAFATDSLVLLSDAGHMATDALGLGIAIAAITAASRARQHPHRTFGLYRLEILAALANAVLLVAVGGYVLVEAVLRLRDAPDVPATPVLLVGILGLLVNLGGFALLRRGATESLNVKGAYLEVLADLLGSVGVVVAAIVWKLTGWRWVDPVVGAAIGVFILPRAFRLGRDTVRVLVQAAPRGLDLEAVEHDLRGIDGVVDVHDLHVWTLTSEMEVVSAHVMVAVGVDTHPVLDRARHLLADRYGLTHATLQVEPADHAGCDEVTW